METTFLAVMILLNLMAPMPPEIAINPETGECGYYQGGDEYTSYQLPAPWEVIRNPTIQTETGVTQWTGNVEEYCTMMGYTYISGNIATLYGQAKKSPVYYSMLICKIAPLLLAIMLILIGASIFKKYKNKRNRVDHSHPET